VKRVSPNFRVNIKWLWLVLLIALVLVAWQLSSLVQVDAFKVHARVKDTPPGYAHATAHRGRPPPGLVRIADDGGDILYINTDIDFGTVFPGEEVTGHFTVHLKEGYDQVTYSVNMTLKNAAGVTEMREFLVTQRHYGTGDTDSETGNDIADGTIGDWDAEGTLDRDAGDTFDEWWVTFYVPDGLGEYGAEILIIPEPKTTVD